MAFIYLIQWHNPAMTMYIGSTKDFEERKRTHFMKMRLGTHPNLRMMAMFAKGYSYEMFVLEQTDGNILEVEQCWLDAFNATKDRAFANIAQAFGGKVDHIKNDKEITLVNQQTKEQKDFPSLKAAAGFLNCPRSSVSHVLNGDWNQVRGHRVFLKGQVPEELSLPPIGHQVMVRVRLTHNKTGETHEFDSVTEAAIFLGDIKRVGNISHVLNGRFQSTFGYKAERI